MEYRRHPDWLALVAAVRAAPDDDLPRLVAADWLDEHDQAGRAEFIRVQCQLTKTACPDACGGSAGCECPRRAWRGRERELWEAHARAWAEPVTGLVVTPPAGGAADRTEASDTSGNAVEFRRGFAHTIRGHLSALLDDDCRRCSPHVAPEDWFGLGIPPRTERCPGCRGTGRVPGTLERVLREHPVERAEATDREPLRAGGAWVWVVPADFGFGRHFVPADLHALMGGSAAAGGEVAFPTRDTARDALSAALLARAQARPPSAEQAGGL